MCVALNKGLGGSQKLTLARVVLGLSVVGNFDYSTERCKHMLQDWDLQDLCSLWTPSSQKVQQIIVFLHGRNELGRRQRLVDWEWQLAAVQHLLPYGPYGWMHESRAELIDEMVARLLQQYGDLPLVLAGGSMGGHAALTYLRWTRHAYSRCQVNCPVTDLKKCYDVVEDARRSMVIAYADQVNNWDELRSVNVVSNVAELQIFPVM